MKVTLTETVLLSWYGKMLIDSGLRASNNSMVVGLVLSSHVRLSTLLLGDILDDCTGPTGARKTRRNRGLFPEVTVAHLTC